MEVIPGLVKLVPLVKGLLVGAACLGVWVTTIELRTRSVEQHEHELNAIQLWKASTESSRYTATEANKAAQAVAELLNAHDKRIQRIEDAHISISQTLTRIEHKLEP